MPEIIRARNCIVFHKGDTLTVAIDDAMAAGGWPGGQGVMWKDSSQDEFLTTYSDGRGVGFLIWGSDEDADQFTALTRNQPTYRFAVMIFGNSLISTSSFEQYTYASRIAGPPFVPLVYGPNDPLYFSLRGLWTKEDEATLSGKPYAPLDPVGIVAQLPKPSNNNFLGIQTL